MRAFLLYLLFFISLETQAQLMDWGYPQKLASKNFYCKFIGFNNGGYYYIRSKKSDFRGDITIEKYSANLSLQWSKPIQSYKLNEIVLQVLLMQNGILIISAEENYSSGFTEVKSLALSPEGELAAQNSHLFQVKTSAFYDDDPFERFILKVNELRNLYVVCYLMEGEKKQAVINYNLFSETSISIGPGGYAYNTRTDQFFINEILINNFTIYCLVSYNDINKKNSDLEYLHDVLALNYNSKIFSRIPIVLEGKIQSDLGICIDTLNNALKLTGFYSEKKSTSAAGIAIYTLPLDDPEHYSSGFMPFPKELLARIIGERASEKTREVEDFVVHRIVPRSDGGLLLIAECFYIEKQPYNSYTSGVQGITPQQTIIRNIYNYDEIMVFSLDSMATIDWWQVIVKNQNSVNDNGYNLSFTSLVKRDMIYIFFNLNYHNSNEIMEYSINSNGKMRNKILFKSTNYYIDFAPRQSSQIATGSILMPLVKDRKFNLLKLTY